MGPTFEDVLFNTAIRNRMDKGMTYEEALEDIKRYCEKPIWKVSWGEVLIMLAPILIALMFYGIYLIRS